MARENQRMKHRRQLAAYQHIAARCIWLAAAACARRRYRRAAGGSMAKKVALHRSSHRISGARASSNSAGSGIGEQQHGGSIIAFGYQTAARDVKLKSGVAGAGLSVMYEQKQRINREIIIS
jgi:hypothetical protein